MAERAYTVSEIDDLHEVCRQRYLFGTTKPREGTGSYNSRSYNEVEMEKVLTQRMRQYMNAGVTADDIRAEDLK